MKKMLFILLLTLGMGTTWGQVTIWSETFASYTNGTGIDGTGNIGDYPSGVSKWTLDASNATLSNNYDYFKTYNLSNNQVMTARDTDGDVIWLSEDIDISNYSDVQLGANFKESGDLEYSDYYRIEYQLDGGAWTQFANNGYQSGNFGGWDYASQTGLNGSTVKIRITVNCNADNEYINFDTIKVKGKNKDTEVYDTGSQPAAATISSLVDTDGEAIEVFQMEIQDQGSGDGLATKVTNIRLKPNTTNTADWIDNIQGFVIYDSDLNEYTPASVSITDSAIDFAFNAGDLDVPDNTTLDLSFYVYLNTSNIEDGKILSFKVVADDHGFTADSSGSTFADNFLLGDFNSNDFEIVVEATELQFIQQPTDVAGNAVMSPAVTVAYTDANGNIDVDYDGLGATATLSATGATLATSTTTDGTPVQGVMTFNDIKFVTAGSGVTLTVSDGGNVTNTNVTSDSFDVTGEQEISIKANDIEIADGDTTPSQIDKTDFRHIKVNGSSALRTYTIYNSGSVDLNLTGTPIVSISGTNASDFTVTTAPSTPVAGGSDTTFTIKFDPSDYGVRTATVSIDNNDSDENPYTFDIQGTGAEYTDCTGIDYIQDFETTPAQPELTYTNTSHIYNSNGISASLYPTGDNYYVSGTNAKYLNNYNTGGTLWFNSVDTRNYTDIEFSIRVASFSGTSGNGADLVDHVEILVSTDDGATWSEELEVTGADSPYNAKWSFDSGTGIAQVAYDGDNTKTTFTPASGGYRTADGYSTMKITNLPSVEKLKIKIWVKNNSSDEYWMLDDAKLIGRNATTWSSGAWSNGAPDETTKLIINDDYDTTNGNLHTCECEVKSGKTLTISDGSNIVIETDIANDGTILVSNEGSLVQHKSDASITGSGTYQLNKTSLALNHYYDYVYWSSPLNSSTFELGDIVADAWRYYKFDPNEANNGHTYPGWVQLAATDIPNKGVGYAISAPNGTSSAYTVPAQFVKDHDPFNNGDITVPILMKGGPDNIGDYNLLGNPYPSAIDFNAFSADAANSGNIEAAYSLWTNCAGLNGNAHQDSGYTTYSASGTNTAACNGSGGTAQAGRYIATAQGFMVKATTDNSTVTFKNTFRITDNNDGFLNRSTNRDIAWIDMTDATGKFSQIAVGFYPGATDAYDRNFDAHSMNTGSGFALYSLVSNEKLAIQGLPEWDDTDKVVPLGVESGAANSITFHLNRTEGLSGIHIYLRDLDLGITHELTATDYTTAVSAGNLDARFELLFTPNLLGEQQLIIDPNTVLLIQNNSLFSLQAQEDHNITGLTVYDLSGRVLFEKQNLHTTGYQVNLKQVATGNLLLFKVQIDGDSYLVKKTIKK